MQVAFIHHRQMERAKGLRTKPTISGKGGVTLAYEQLDSKHVRFAAAKCSKLDNYDKKLGRAKASGRLKSARYAQYVESSIELESRSDIVNLVLSEAHKRGIL